MAIHFFKPLFTDYQAGPKAFIAKLLNPIAPKMDTSLSDEDRNKLQDAIAQTTQKQNVRVLFAGNHPSFEAIEIGHLSFQTKQNVCFIDCKTLTTDYIGETEKNIAQLIAQAENQNWILFFDEADALFTLLRQSPDKLSDNKSANIDPLLIQKLMQYNGLVVLNVHNQALSQRLTHLFDYTVNFS